MSNQLFSFSLDPVCVSMLMGRLCFLFSSGFNREDEWGYRALEPMRCCISSIALVLLKTGIIHHPNGEKPVEVDYTQMTTAQKLLLFWRKPAVRRCFSGISWVLSTDIWFLGLTAQMLVGWDRYRASGDG